jgi:hypothetical protein
MNLTHPQNVLKKREKVNMSDDLEIVPKKALHKMLEMADRIEQLEAALSNLIYAASCIRHWHDSLNGEGMVVSAEHVMLLWKQTDIARAALGEKKDD